MAFMHILAPTDLSAPSNHALRYAFEEAEIHHATLTLLHVLPPHGSTEVYHVQGASGARSGFQEPLGSIPTGFDPATGGSLPTSRAPEPEIILRHNDAEAMEQLRGLVPHIFKGTWDAQVKTGKATDIILQTAQEENADLIVMGTHGYTGLCHTLLGSVAESVMHHARCPLLMVRYEV